MGQMKKHDVYAEVSTDTVDQETLHNAIDSRWVHKSKTPTEVRSRIVAKGYKEEVEDLDGIYASTPLFVILRVLLTVAMARSWKIRLGDASTAFLHAPLASSTSTFSHEKSITRRVLHYGASRRQCMDYVPVQGRGTTTLLQACQIFVSDVYFRKQTSTRIAPTTFTSWSTSMTSWSLEILQRRTRSLRRYKGEQGP